MIKLLVSIVNYNSYDDTLQVIDSIKNTINTLGYQINFFIVDNGSDKKLQEDFMIKLNTIDAFILEKKLLPSETNINIVLDAKNNGFGAANNIVIDYINKTSYYDVMWLLNNDLELDTNCLVSIKPYIEDDNYPILGSVIIENNCRINGTDNMDSFKGYGTPNKNKIDKEIFEVDAVLGTSMFLKENVIKNIEFDENFFMYVEENDLCYRAKQLGIKSYMVKDSNVYHYSGKTFGDKRALRWYYKVRNLLYFKSKNNSKNILLIPYLLLATFKNYKFDMAYYRAYFYGIRDYLTNNFGKIKRESV